ncbi:BTB/POZ domain-containing protein [Planoprotostelium fungivorum]|uniref:BTB/POZ domain-containing protein n=1 Tax=Planoprotostelium fungivorum TaxID=1890364 RepID=A0A2P6NY44_9EUKA|nr:BTB/POZ domain-containing protein [Planoprotostelium fungivorum]
MTVAAGKSTDISFSTGDNFYSTERGNNFLLFLRDSSFYDAILQFPDGQRYQVHRLILSYVSDYFLKLFTQHPNRTVFEVQVEDRERLFPLVLHFVYGGDNVVNQDTAIQLLTMAETFEISKLKSLVGQFLVSSIGTKNATSILLRAIQYDAPDIKARCINVLAKQFCYVDPQEFTLLPYKVFLHIISHEQLNVKEEYELYRIISIYIKTNKLLESTSTTSPTMEEVTQLYSHVRYRFMTYSQLEEVVEDVTVPRDILVEDGMTRLAAWEAPNRVVPFIPRLQPRPRVSVSVEYKGDTGEGIIHWIATGCGRDLRQDPATKGIRVKASSVEKGEPGDLIRKKDSGVEMWTMDVPSSYITIDLGQGRQVIPTCYTLVHCNYNNDILRTWQFQGSNEEDNWMTLSKHINDDSLSGKFVPHSWPLTGVTKAFRYFRILQTGHNSSNRNFLVLSSFEIYGELFED